MSTNTVAAATTISLSSLLGAPSSSVRKGPADNDSEPSTGSAQGGGRLYSALLAALTQFVTTHPAGAAASPGTSSTPATTTPATTATSATPTTTTTTPGTTTTTPATGSTGSAPSTLPQDLQAFLHDLFQALRQAGHSHGGGHHHESDDDAQAPSNTPATTPVATTPAATTPVATTPATTTAGATAPATVATTPTTATTPVPTTPPVTTPVTTNPGIGTGVSQYGRHGIVAELTALIQTLSNGQIVSTTSAAAGTPSNLSSTTLSNLNAAFTKLIGDLGGSTSAAATTGTATSTVTATSSGTGTTGTTSPADTTALQAFLSSFLQDLQSGATGSSSTLGNGVNVTA